MLIRIVVALFASLVAAASASSDGRGVDLMTGLESEEINAIYSQSYALVIGIDGYTDGWPRLQKAVEDADIVGDALEQRGFIVTRAHNLRSSQLLTKIRDFVIEKGEDPEARLFIWFAGHGHTIDGKGYLVPADAPDPEKEPILFRRVALNMGNLAVVMREPQAKHVLFVLDSCFSGQVITSYRSRFTPDIARRSRLPVRQFITSGSADQPVPDDGRFRDLFLRSINGQEPRADQNRDGFVTGRELGEFLQAEVTNLTHERQVPRTGTLNDPLYDDGDFVFRTSYTRKGALTGANSLSLAQCKQGMKRVLTEGQIKFEIGGAGILEQSDSTLKAVTKLINQCELPTKFEISAHTDSIGADEYNLNLSHSRAINVKNWLIENGINPIRLVAVGYGATKPIIYNSEKTKNVLNRRIEIIPHLSESEIKEYWSKINGRK